MTPIKFHQPKIADSTHPVEPARPRAEVSSGGDLTTDGADEDRSEGVASKRVIITPPDRRELKRRLRSRRIRADDANQVRRHFGIGQRAWSAGGGLRFGLLDFVGAAVGGSLSRPGLGFVAETDAKRTTPLRKEFDEKW